MDDFEEYDEFGNYIGAELDQALQDKAEQLLLDDDDQYVQLDTAASTTPISATPTNLHSTPFDSSVEIVVPDGDTIASHQSLMQMARLTDFEDPSTSLQIAAGYGLTNDYQSSFCISEPILPPISASTQNTYPQLINDLLSEQWLQRHFSLIGGHLHGKTALLDLFFSQLHPHVNIQSVTPEIPPLSGAPHNLKPTTAFTGSYNPTLMKNSNPNSNNRTHNCWPVQYADSLYRERSIGHSTSLKPITIPVSVSMPLVDSHSQHFSASYQSPLATKTYLFSITDTPAHSNYIDPTILAIQRCSASGVVLVVDCIEGMTAEIELQLEYAIRNASPMVLVLTKLDRLITELRVPPEHAYLKLANVVESVNMAVLQYYTMYYGLPTQPQPVPGNEEEPTQPQPTPVLEEESTSTRYRCPLFNPIENNVIFTSTLHSWAFTIKSFAMLYLTQQDIKIFRGAGHVAAHPNLPPPPTNFNTNSTNAQKLHKLIRLFWGNVYYDPNSKQFLTKPPQPTDQHQFKRTFVEFILNPLYKMYSACLTGNTTYLEAILGSFYQPSPLSNAPLPQNSPLISDLPVSAPFSPFAIPPHIIASSQDDLLRELVGLWLFAPFHLSTIHERSEGGYDSEDFSIFSRTTLIKPQSVASSTSLHTRLPSNANYAAQLLAAVILDSLPPPILRKAHLQQTTLLYQPPLLPLGPTPSLSSLPTHQSTLTQSHPQTISNPQLRPLRPPSDKFFTPCRVALADIITVVPHPNGTTLDFLCKVHLLSVNNDPLFVDQQDDESPRGQAVARVAFTVGDKITLFRTEDKSYSPPHQLVGIFAPCSNRYRVPLKQCYDGNIVVLSFSTQSANPGSQPSNDPTLLHVQQSDAILLQKFHLPGHGTFINHSATPLGQAQRVTKGDRLSILKNPTPPTIQLEQLDLKSFVPTFTQPIVHPGPDIFNIAIEPTVASELPVLLSTLQRAQCVYGSSLKITKEPTGTHTLSMRGEFLADDIIHYLRVVTGNLSISTTTGQQQTRKIVPPNLQQLSFSISTPFYNFREGVRGSSAIDCTAMSIGHHNQITTSAHNATTGPASNILPDQQSYSDLLHSHPDNLHLAKQYHNYLKWSSRRDSIHLVEPSHIAKSMNLATAAHLEQHQNRRNAPPRDDRESLIFGSNRLYSTFHTAHKFWDTISQTQTPWSFGLLDDANVELVDKATRGSHTTDSDTSFLSPSRWKFDHVASVVNGFNRLTLEGPLTESPLHNITMKITELSISANPLQSTSRHLIPAVRKSLSGAMLLASPTLYEPVIRGEIIISRKYDAEVHKLLGNRRGIVLSTIPIPLTPYTRYVYKLPAIESTGFGIDARVIAKGQSRLSGGSHLCYEMMQGDPLDMTIPVLVVKVAALNDLPRDLMVKTRRRKGLPEFDINQHFDPEMLAHLEALVD